jgi:hypothetical protein
VLRRRAYLNGLVAEVAQMIAEAHTDCELLVERVPDVALHEARLARSAVSGHTPSIQGAQLIASSRWRRWRTCIQQERS